MEYKKKEYFKALNLSKKALNIINGNIEVSYYKALCLFQTKRYSEAEGIFKNLYLVDKKEKTIPNLKKTYLICLMKQEKYTIAEEFIKKENTLKKDLQISNIYGYILEKTNRIQEAIATYKEILREEQNNVNACNSLAYCFYKINTQIEKALQLVQKALEKEPENTSYLDTYAMLLLRKDEKELAYKVFQKVMQAAPNNPIIQEHKRIILRECTLQ